jgi:hypothetical protein
MEYALKNKDYIRKHIDLILPLITSFPETDTQWLGRGETNPQPLAKKK